jgi:D-alanyl-D-alanine carboxypeptidase
LLALACIAACGSSSSLARTAGSPPVLSAQIARAIDSDVRKELRAFGGRRPIPGALIALWLPGKAPFFDSVGYADVAKRKPFARNDAFRIGSITKTFVVTVLLQLVDEKRLRLDDPLSAFQLGLKVPGGDHITVRQLCEMRSGLSEVYNTPELQKLDLTPETHVNPRQIVSWALKQKPLFAPGTRYRYSNTNYLLLGLIIESLTDDTLENQIRKRILVPLALHATSFPRDDPNMPAAHVHGYGLGERGEWQDVTNDANTSLFWAAGAMISTAPDMKRWVEAYVRGTVNAPATQRERLHCLPTGDEGLGFGLGIGCSGGWLGYTGGLPGYNAAAYELPSKNATLIVFVNAQRHRTKPGARVTMGAANAIARDITRLVTPENILFR